MKPLHCPTRLRHAGTARMALLALPQLLLLPLLTPVLALVLALVPQAGHAQGVAYPSFTTEPINLRAGPSPDYPLVTQLPPQLQLNVVGCAEGYQWCDVLLPDGLRGWAYGHSLSYSDRGQSLALSVGGAQIGIPLLAFSVGEYWGTHYRNRPFYNEPRYWGGNPPPRYAGPAQHYPYPQYPHPAYPQPHYPQGQPGYGYPQQHFPQHYPNRQPQRPGYLGDAPGIVSPSTGIVGGQAPGIVGRTPHHTPGAPQGVFGGPPSSVRPGAGMPSLAPAQPARPFVSQPIGTPPRFQPGAGPGALQR